MLPNGFVDWDEQAEDMVLTAPIIKKVGEAACNYNKDNANKGEEL